MGMLVVAAFVGRTRGSHLLTITADPSPNQIRCEPWQSIDLIFYPSGTRSRHSLLRKASILQAPMECAQAFRECLRRRAIEEAHGRHHRLLCPRRERPRCRAAREGDELASSHSASRRPAVGDVIAFRATGLRIAHPAARAALRDFDPTYRRFGS